MSDYQMATCCNIYPDSGGSILSNDEIFMLIIGSQVIGFPDQSDWSKIQQELAEPVPRLTPLLDHFAPSKL